MKIGYTSGEVTAESQSLFDELKWEIHCARSALQYQHNTVRVERGRTRNQQLEGARARLDAALLAYGMVKPEPVSMRVRSPYFIGPRRTKGVRGDGPTIRCFRCEEVKPVSEYYDKGTLCKCCIVNRAAEWADKNPDRVAEIKRASTKERKKNDPGYRVMMNCRCRLGDILKKINAKRGSHFSELIGTTSRGLASHFQALFLPGMTWDNYGWGPGKWVADHIMPARNFDHLIDEEIKRAWHYTNLQPMWWRENQEKSDFLPCGRRARHVKILLTT